MQLVRYLAQDGAFWGNLEGGRIHRLSDMLGTPTGSEDMLSDVSLLPPCEPRSIVCVGKNYADHIREMGGSSDDLPQEGELAVVIGKEMRNVPEEEALDYVLGYTCAIDVTARDKQRSDLQWTRGKSADGFCPVGPWLVRDFDPSAVSLETRVNGEVRQSGNTRDLIFPVQAILAYISTFLTLKPGDLVLTGTPEGVGPLQVGDEVEVEIEGIGTLKNSVEEA